jgi:hypothetical protein
MTTARQSVRSSILVSLAIQNLVLESQLPGENFLLPRYMEALFAEVSKTNDPYEYRTLLAVSNVSSDRQPSKLPDIPFHRRSGPGSWDSTAC